MRSKWTESWCPLFDIVTFSQITSFFSVILAPLPLSLPCRSLNTSERKLVPGSTALIGKIGADEALNHLAPSRRALLLCVSGGLKLSQVVSLHQALAILLSEIQNWWEYGDLIENFCCWEGLREREPGNAYTHVVGKKRSSQLRVCGTTGESEALARKKSRGRLCCFCSRESFS